MGSEERKEGRKEVRRKGKEKIERRKELMVLK